LIIINIRVPMKNAASQPGVRAAACFAKVSHIFCGQNCEQWPPLSDKPLILNEKEFLALN
jgi:hypothetical protein